MTVCPGLTLKNESRYKYIIKLWSTQKLIFQDQEIFISSAASAKGGMCVVVAVVVPFHQTEGTKGMVQPGARSQLKELPGVRWALHEESGVLLGVVFSFLPCLTSV